MHEMRPLEISCWLKTQLLEKVKKRLVLGVKTHLRVLLQ